MWTYMSGWSMDMLPGRRQHWLRARGWWDFLCYEVINAYAARPHELTIPYSYRPMHKVDKHQDGACHMKVF
jgi:hypothetical protein